MAISMYSSRKPNTNQSSIGGVSAVNPQSKGDFNQYIDAAYTATKGRLDPIFDQQRSAYDQKMQNMGIPIGGEAYNKSLQQMDQNFNDAYTGAAYDAMGFGLGAQAQDFGQDATRSQLANALLQSKWGTESGLYGMDLNNALGYAGLNENARQFDNTLGYNYAGLGEGARQFDSTQDYNYWNQGNQFDYLWDRAEQGDMQWLTEFDQDIWNDQLDQNRWSDTMSQFLINPFIPDAPNAANPFIQGSNSNMLNYGQQYGNYSDWWDSAMNWGSEIDWAKIFGGN